MPHVSETGLRMLRGTSKRITTWAADIGSTWRRWAALRGRGQRNEYERFFAGSVDRFELERRERDWTRWQSSDGSLLGR
jgi:hypothetical protein